jgi:hypothetical protein
MQYSLQGDGCFCADNQATHPRARKSKQTNEISRRELNAAWRFCQLAYDFMPAADVRKQENQPASRVPTGHEAWMLS